MRQQEVKNEWVYNIEKKKERIKKIINKNQNYGNKIRKYKEY